MKSLLIVACAFALTYGLPKNVNNKIVHGQPAKDGEFPYQVALVEHGHIRCGGSLIKPNMILTSAHCVTQDIGDLKAHVGAISLDDPNAQVRQVTTIVLHQFYYGQPTTHDIALVILDEAFVLSDKVQLIEIETDEVPSDSVVTATGWGLNDNQEFPSNLMAVNTTIVDCADYAPDVLEEIVCTDGYQAICVGDAGGPLVYNGKQIGIASAGATLDGFCGSKGSFNFYINTKVFYPWIQKNLDIYSTD